MQLFLNQNQTTINKKACSKKNGTGFFYVWESRLIKNA